MLGKYNNLSIYPKIGLKRNFAYLRDLFLIGSKKKIIIFLVAHFFKEFTLREEQVKQFLECFDYILINRLFGECLL